MKDILNNSELFKGLTDQEFKQINSIVKEENLKEGQRLFNKGDNADKLYIVKSGSIDISVNMNMDWGNEDMRLARMSKGDVIGELSFFDGNKRSASAISFIDSEVIFIQRKDYDKLVEQNKELGLKILTNAFKLVSKRLRKSNTSVSDMARNLYFY